VPFSLPHRAPQFPGGSHPGGGVSEVKESAGGAVGGRPGDCPSPGAGAGFASGPGVGGSHHRGGQEPPGGPGAGAGAGGRGRQFFNLSGKDGGLDPADPKGQKTPLPLSRVSHHPGGKPRDYAGLRCQVPDSPAFAPGGSANSPPASGGASGRPVSRGSRRRPALPG